MGLSVIVPTYKRHNDLSRLFQSFYDQVLKPDEVLVIIGPDDKESIEVTRNWQTRLPFLHFHEIKKASVIHSLNFGLSVAKHEVIGLIDDDVWLPPDWALKITTAFKMNPKLGAFGGRDHLQLPNEPHLSHPAPASVVGAFKRSGTLEGNHHCGAQNSPLHVDVLKGCNLSFFRGAFKRMEIDKALEGTGAETCWEIDICQNILLAGFEIEYDNDNYVLHYVAARLSVDNRTDIFSPAWKGRVFNEALVFAKFRPMTELFIFGLRTMLVGSKLQPGLLRSFSMIGRYSWKVLLLPWRNMLYLRRGVLKGLKHRRAIEQ